MAAPEYWMAACQHPTCGWEAVMGSPEDAEVAKEGHAMDHPDHLVTVLPSDRVQAQYMVSLRHGIPSSPPEGLLRLEDRQLEATSRVTDCGECRACARGR